MDTFAHADAAGRKDGDHADCSRQRADSHDEEELCIFYEIMRDDENVVMLYDTAGIPTSCF